MSGRKRDTAAPFCVKLTYAVEDQGEADLWLHRCTGTVKSDEVLRTETYDIMGYEGTFLESERMTELCPQCKAEAQMTERHRVDTETEPFAAGIRWGLELVAAGVALGISLLVAALAYHNPWIVVAGWCAGLSMGLLATWRR